MHSRDALLLSNNARVSDRHMFHAGLSQTDLHKQFIGGVYGGVYPHHV